MIRHSQPISRRVWIYIYAPVFLWLLVIFYLSSGNGSMAETSKIIGPIVKFFFPSADESFVQSIHAIIRKLAHVTEYAILAGLSSRAFLKSQAAPIRSSWAIFAIGLVAVTATIDEFNQSFNVQRTSSPLDVLLDISGGALAIAIIWLFLRRQRK